MSEAAVLQTQTIKAPPSNSHSLLIQRKCACGGSSGLTGTCSDCEKKKLLEKPLQTKLRINEPSDEYEQEADRVAEQIMRMREPGQEMDSTTPVTPLVQRKVSINSAGIGAAPPIVHDVLSSPGQPLDSATRAFFEPRFGHDFGNVRVHADARAAESARSVNALAFTVGSHIVFGRQAPQATGNNTLLAHELTHVVQQSGREAYIGELQRAPLGGSEASTGNVTDEAFLSEALDFLESFRDIRDQIADLGVKSSTAYRLQIALKQFDEQWRSMDYYDKFGPGEFYGLLEYVGQVLRLYEEVIPEASMQVRTESDVTTLANVRNRLASLNSQLIRLQGRSFIKSKAEQVKEHRAAQSQAALEAQALESARRETPEGRREDAVAFTRSFVTNERQWWSGQALSTAEVFAEELGGYYLREMGLAGADIQMVLATLGEEDPELLDRALYQGELLGYLHDQGVTGLSFGELPHATGSGFYNGFEFTWRDLMSAQPVSIPSFSPPTPLDVMKYQWGMQWGILVGIKDGVVSTAQDVLSLFQVETYTQLYNMLANQIWDESWREEMGKSFAIALHAYLQDVGNDGPFEIGKRFGRFIGQAVFEIILGIVTAGVIKVVTKALRGTKWGAALLDFADDVARAMPWREPKVVEGEVVPDTSPRSALETATSRRAAALEAPSGIPSAAGSTSGKDVPRPKVKAPQREEITPPAGRTELEDSVKQSSKRENDELTETEKINEVAWVDAHPEVVSGSPGQKKARLGEHEIVSVPGVGCQRHSTGNPIDIPCPLPLVVSDSGSPDSVAALSLQEPPRPNFAWAEPPAIPSMEPLHGTVSTIHGSDVASLPTPSAVAGVPANIQLGIKARIRSKFLSWIAAYPQLHWSIGLAAEYPPLRWMIGDYDEIVSLMTHQIDDIAERISRTDATEIGKREQLTDELLGKFRIRTQAALERVKKHPAAENTALNRVLAEIGTLRFFGEKLLDLPRIVRDIRAALNDPARIADAVNVIEQQRRNLADASDDVAASYRKAVMSIADKRNIPVKLLWAQRDGKIVAMTDQAGRTRSSLKTTDLANDIFDVKHADRTLVGRTRRSRKFRGKELQREYVLNDLVFLREVVGSEAWVIDESALGLKTDHGAITHIIQDLVVDEVLKKYGLTAIEFRTILSELKEQGSTIWLETYDIVVPETTLSRPETMWSAIREALGIRKDDL